MNPLQELIEEIQSVLLEESWSVGLEFALGLLDLTMTDFVKYRYSLRDLDLPYDPLYTPDRFDESSVHELMDLLEYCGFEPVPAFRSAGLFLPGRDQIDWQEFYVSVFLSKLSQHDIQKDALETALAASSSRDAALLFYLESVIDPDSILEQAVSLFLESKGIENHAFSRRILKSLVQTWYGRREIVDEDLYRTIFPALEQSAVKSGILSGQEFEDYITTGPVPDEVMDALSRMGLKKLPTVSKLKSKYRQLMKEHHPDRNPAGLEIARSINVSYAVVLGYLFNQS